MHAIMASFADPVIMLFIGGFVLAIAAAKTGLDALVAKVLLKPFGKQSVNVLLGFLLITGFFSMFVSDSHRILLRYDSPYQYTTKCPCILHQHSEAKRHDESGYHHGYHQFGTWLHHSHTRWQFFVSMIKTNLNITTKA